MNKIKILFIAIFMIALSQSCSDDYLETRPTSFANVELLNDIADFDPSIYDGVLTGVYATLHQSGSGGTGAASDLGHRGYDIFTDMMSSDMVLAGLNYGWYRGVADYTWIQNANNTRNYMPWRFYYRIIFGANSVIDAQGGSDFEPTDPSARYVMGQAKALRAFGYFYLTQLFQTDYDPNEVLLPLYTKAELSNTAQVPMSDIFALIEDDLTKAVDYLDGYNREFPFQINKYIAEGLLAYAYAAQGKYDEALPLCTDIINNSGFTPLAGDLITGGFNDVENYEDSWMWAIDCTPDMELNLASWYGKMDIFTYSYAWAGDTKDIDESLYNKMPADDLRRAQFGHPQYGPYVPSQKFYNPDRTIGGTSSDYNTMDYMYMRVSEFYLLGAEAAYKTGSPLANTYLKGVVSKRVGDASYVDGLSGQPLMDEISLQTRLELWGEGKSYLLMKRNDEMRTRGSNHLLLAGETISHNEARVSFQLPTSERQNNPYID